MLLATAMASGAGPLQPASEALNPLVEYRQCGEPVRTQAGEIKRSSAVLAAFKRYHPCPATGQSYGACPGWAVDHVISLAAGGCDSVSNMAWMPVQIKSCSSQYCKDRWERKYYGSPHGIVTFSN
jgi:hypothetical protein